MIRALFKQAYDILTVTYSPARLHGALLITAKQVTLPG